MDTRTVHLEDVIRAARQGLALSVLVSLALLAAMLVAGTSAPVAVLGAAAALVGGVTSGGFGLVARLTTDHHLGSRDELRNPAGGRRSRELRAGSVAVFRRRRAAAGS
jgi:hypothetical protein